MFTAPKEERFCFLVVDFDLIGRATVQPYVVFSFLQYVTYPQAAITALSIPVLHMGYENVTNVGTDNSGR